MGLQKQKLQISNQRKVLDQVKTPNDGVEHVDPEPEPVRPVPFLPFDHVVAKGDVRDGHHKEEERQRDHNDTAMKMSVAPTAKSRY